MMIREREREPDWYGGLSLGPFIVAFVDIACIPSSLFICMFWPSSRRIPWSQVEPHSATKVIA
jgi:hypothetical protein